MLQAQSYQHKVSVVFLLFSLPLQHSPSSQWWQLPLCSSAGMRRIACATWAMFSSPCQSGSGFLVGQLSAEHSGMWWWDCCVPAPRCQVQSQQHCPGWRCVLWVSPVPLCKMWHNYGSTEKQGQEKGGIYHSLHIVSFELVANGFCVDFFLVLSRFNSSVGCLYSFCCFKWDI